MIPETREAWRGRWTSISAAEGDLSRRKPAGCKRNPLRILDSKDHAGSRSVDNAPEVDDYPDQRGVDFFAAVTAGLDAAGVPWTRNPRLVRGLDYYRHTAFEFVTDRLGAQGTVIAGGRYDGLIEALGGPHTPAVGWAAGIERLAMMIEAPQPDRPSVVLVPLGERAEADAQRVLAGLRREGVAADMAFRGNHEEAATAGPMIRARLMR